MILDLRFVNKHVWKPKVKFEVLKVALNYFDKGHFMFSFDIKRGYHHVLIFPAPPDIFGFFLVLPGLGPLVLFQGPALRPLFNPFCLHKDF